MNTSRLRYFLIPLCILVMHDSAFSQQPDSRQLPASWMEHAMYFRVPVEDVGAFDYKPYIFLGENEAGPWRIMTTGLNHPDQYGVFSIQLQPEELGQLSDPPSYLLLGLNNSGGSYYNVEIQGVNMHQVIAALVISGIEVTGIRPRPFYEYENESAKDLLLTLSGERQSLEGVLSEIAKQTGCEFGYRDATLLITGCP